jgi:hypothetical protein
MLSQLQLEKHYGFNVGFVSAIGTHFQRFGIVFQGYGAFNFAQINASFRVYDNFKNLGPRGEHTEFNAALGFCIGYGTKTTEKNMTRQVASLKKTFHKPLKLQLLFFLSLNLSFIETTVWIEFAKTQ